MIGLLGQGMNALVPILAVGLCGCATIDGKAIVWPNPKACVAAEFPLSTRKRIEIARGIRIETVFEITSKGNGGVDLPGLYVRVYDDHDDGVVFQDHLLRCEWRDIDNDGFRDFVVNGIAIRTDENSGSVSSVPVRGVFRYVAEHRCFEVAGCSPDIYFSAR